MKQSSGVVSCGTRDGRPAGTDGVASHGARQDVWDVRRDPPRYAGRHRTRGRLGARRQRSGPEIVNRSKSPLPCIRRLHGHCSRTAPTRRLSRDGLTTPLESHPDTPALRARVRAEPTQVDPETLRLHARGIGMRTELRLGMSRRPFPACEQRHREHQLIAHRAVAGLVVGVGVGGDQSQLVSRDSVLSRADKSAPPALRRMGRRL